MSTARELLREVKRRLGDTTTPYPDETDSLAFLNMAVQGIHNYGVYLKSDRLKKIVEVTATGGVYTPTDGIAFTEEVINKDTNKILTPLTDPKQLLRISTLTNTGVLYYRIDGDTIRLFPTPDANTTQNLIVSYFPRLTAIASRDSNVPFSPELDNVIETWTIAIITNQAGGVSDIELATKYNLGNTLGRYFRGQTKVFQTGRGPW